MYKLLIVDDEIWLRERLKQTINWEELGVVFSGEATDGEEALTLTVELCSDIVITDIRMPCVDGLQYIGKIKEMGINTKVIIISGYSDFEYAQSAIKLGAFDYILKPIEDEDLISVINRCTSEITHEHTKDELFQRVQEQGASSCSFLREKFFINLINGYYMEENTINNELTKLDLNYENFNNVCFIIELDLKTQLSEDKKVIQSIVVNIISNDIKALNQSDTFFVHTGEIICFIFSKSTTKDLSQDLNNIIFNIKQKIFKATDCSVTIGIGNVYSKIKDLTKSYNEAKEALQYKAFIGNNNIYVYNTLPTKYKIKYNKFKNTNKLLNNICIGNKLETLVALNDLINQTKIQGEIFPIDLKFLYIDIVNSVYKSLKNTNSFSETFDAFSFTVFKQMNFLNSLEETYNWLCDTIIKMIDHLEIYHGIKKRKVIEKALEYINIHYSEQITLKEIADKFYLNPSYFCKIFKEEMGEPFTKYFINLRIQKAKGYLTDPTLKIYEIAQLVGYTDIQYFTKIFKTFQGVTPIQYREKVK